MRFATSPLTMMSSKAEPTAFSIDEVVAVTADEEVGALAARDGVVAEAAVDRQFRHRRPTVDDERVVRALGVRDADERRQPRHGDGGSGAEHLDRVAGARPVDGDRVGLSVAAAERSAKVDLDARRIGAGQVADGDRVGAAERVEGDRLDVVHIHGDGGDVAGEPRVSAVRRDVDVLGDVRAVEQKRVGSVLALDRVAAVARIPHEGVVAGAEKRRVVAASAGDEVAAVAAKKQVVAVAAGDGVVAGAAVDGDLDQRREAVAGGEPVVAAVHVEDDVLGRADVEGERCRIMRSKRTRAPFAVSVKVSLPLPPLTSAVSVSAPPSNRSVSSPGFQIMRSFPASPKTWSSPSPPVSTSLPSPPNRKSAPPLPKRMSLSPCPKSWSLPEPP